MVDGFGRGEDGLRGLGYALGRYLSIYLSSFLSSYPAFYVASGVEWSGMERNGMNN